MAHSAQEEGEPAHTSQQHQLRLYSLLHPHLHAVLNQSAQAGLPAPRWTATQPEEKRSISSDKTITPGSSISTKTPKATLQVQAQTGSQQGEGDNGRLSSSPSNLTSAWSTHDAVIASSPTSDHSQHDFALDNSGAASPSRSRRKDTVVDPFAKKKEERLRQQQNRPKTENELWIEVADAVKVVADGLREEDLRGPFGEETLIIHVLTFLTLSITHEPQYHEPNDANGSNNNRAPHSRSPSSDSLNSITEAAARLNGIAMAQTQCLRCLANLCIDNDANRSHLLQHDTPLFILTLIKNVLNSEPANSSHFDEATLLLLKTAMGALLNLQLDHPPSRRWLLRLPKPRRHHHPHEQHGHLSGNSPQSHNNGASTEPDEANVAVNSPFELEETATIGLLLAVAADARIYTPWEALNSILGPRAGEFEAEEMFEDDGAGGSDSQENVYPSHKNWATVVLGAEVASWAARVAEDLLAFEAEDAQAESDESADMEPSMLATPAKIALASREETWPCLLTPLASFIWRNPRTHLSAEPPEGEIPEDAAAFVDADLAVLSLSGQLLEGCSHISKGHDSAAKLFKSHGLAHLDNLLDFIQYGVSPFGTNTSPIEARLERFGLDRDDLSSVGKEVARAKANAVKAAVAIAGEDSNMAVLFGETGESPFLARMSEWLQVDRYQREDLVSCALLSIANLARSDQNCIALAKSSLDLVPLLVSLLQNKGSLLLTHAALGLLKNLSIPSTNKQLIGATPGIFDILPAFLSKERDQAQPIQFSAIGVIKHLAFSQLGGVAYNASAICRGTTLDSLLALIARTSDVPTRLESTRVLVNLIRTLSAPDSSEDAKKRLRDRRVINALADMIRRSAKYPVLINEGLVSLTLLITGTDTDAKAEQAFVVSNALLGNVIAQKSDRSSPTSSIEPLDVSENNNSSALTRGQNVPNRSSTMDSTTSAYSSTTATNSPETAADILYDVLSRPSEVTRAPVQFSENACTLLTTASALHQEGDEAIQSLAIKMLPALRALKARESGASTAKAAVQAIEACEKAAF